MGVDRQVDTLYCIYRKEVEGSSVQGKPQVKWIDKVDEYMMERGTGYA